MSLWLFWSILWNRDDDTGRLSDCVNIVCLCCYHCYGSCCDLCGGDGYLEILFWYRSSGRGTRKDATRTTSKETETCDSTFRLCQCTSSIVIGATKFSHQRDECLDQTWTRELSFAFNMLCSASKTLYSCPAFVLKENYRLCSWNCTIFILKKRIE